jgi:hypothetical protein
VVLFVLALGQVAVDGVHGPLTSVIKGRSSGLRGGTTERPSGVGTGCIKHRYTLENVKIYLPES